MTHFDTIIIGSGQGGVPLATTLADDGKEVALFERSLVGGTCVNYGCIPSKTFLEAAHAAAIGRYAEGMGVRVKTYVEFSEVMARVRRISQGSREGVEERLRSAGVTLVAAEAAFADENTVVADGMRAEAPLIVINTGKSPLIPDIPGLKDTPYFTYENLWALNALPPRCIVLGGGYVGVELAQGLARLGSETHVIERSERLISDEEADVSEVLLASLQKDGVHFHLNSEATEVKHGDNLFSVRTDGGDEIHGEALIIAAGHKPNTAALAVDKAGLLFDDVGHIRVDARFQTPNPHVYAIGDVIGQPAFTHVSWEDHRRLLDILAGGDREQGDRVLGYGFFTEPQVGRVGLTLAQAEEAGYEARAVTLPLEHVIHATLANRTEGFYRMVIDETTDKILGATLVGPQAAELVHVFLAHMEAGSTWQVLERSVHIHPCYAEGLPSLARKLRS